MTIPHARFSLNQATIKYANLREALDLCVAQGVQSIGLWREPVNEVGLTESAKLLADSGLRFSSHCRSGFLTDPDDAAWRASLDENRRAIEETATLAAAGAPGSAAVLVVVAGGIPEGGTIADARARFAEGIATLAPEAQAAGVTLALEALHPMFASDRCVLSTLGQALDIADAIGSPAVGAVVDSFHVWWDPDVAAQVARAGAAGQIATYQVCDWKTPLPADVLLSRHLPGDGVIDFASLTETVNAAGYTGDVEVEVFNGELWDTPYAEALEATWTKFNAVVGVHLAEVVPA